jgi:hypothetical protein
MVVFFSLKKDIIINVPPNFSKDANVGPLMKQRKKKSVSAHF